MSSVSWSLDPLLYASLPTEMLQATLGSITVYRGMYIGVIGLSLSYMLVHKLLLKYFATYRDIPTKSNQVAVLHHAVEALVLFISFPFFTYYMAKVFLQVHELNSLSYLKPIFILMSLIITMYMMELASRYDNVRPIVLIHHVLSALDGLLGIFFPSTLMAKTCTALMYFICFEMLTFTGLFMYRIFPQSKLTPRVIFAGIIMFGGSRPFQLLWVGGVIFAAWWGDENEDFVVWHALTQAIVTLVLTALQVWTLKIHYGIWKRSCQITMTSSRMNSDFSKDGDGSNMTPEDDSLSFGSV